MQDKLIPDERPEGRPMNIPLELLVLPEHTPVKPTARFIASVKAFGVLEPISVIDKGEEFRVVDGVRRVLAAREADLGWVPAVVHEDAENLASLITLVANEQRSSNPVAELDAIKELMEKGASLNDLVEATGMRKPTIIKRMKLMGLRVEAMDKLRAGKMTVGVAARLAQLPTDEQLAIVEAAGDGRVTHEAIRATRATGTSGMVDQLAVLDIPGLGQHERLQEAAPVLYAALKRVLKEGLNDTTREVAAAAVGLVDEK